MHLQFFFYLSIFLLSFSFCYYVFFFFLPFMILFLVFLRDDFVIKVYIYSKRKRRLGSYTQQRWRDTSHIFAFYYFYYCSQQRQQCIRFHLLLSLSLSLSIYFFIILRLIQKKADTNNELL